MFLTDELTQKTIELLGDYPELKENILLGDAESIREVGRISQQGIMPEEIIKLYEEGKILEIYNKSKKLIAMQKLYTELCNQYYEKEHGISKK